MSAVIAEGTLCAFVNWVNQTEAEGVGVVVKDKNAALGVFLSNDSGGFIKLFLAGATLRKRSVYLDEIDAAFCLEVIIILIFKFQAAYGADR